MDCYPRFKKSEVVKECLLAEMEGRTLPIESTTEKKPQAPQWDTGYNWKKQRSRVCMFVWYPVLTVCCWPFFTYIHVCVHAFSLFDCELSGRICDRQLNFFVPYSPLGHLWSLYLQPNWSWSHKRDAAATSTKAYFSCKPFRQEKERYVCICVSVSATEW